MELWIVALIVVVVFWLHQEMGQKVFKVSRKMAEVEREIELMRYELSLLQSKADGGSK